MSSAKAKVILHIGQHKTGSKALQSFLALNAAQLKDQGILYALKQTPDHHVPAYSNSHFHCYALARHEAIIDGGDLSAARQFWSEFGLYCAPYTSLEQVLNSLETERSKTGAHTIVISAEDFFDMQSAHDVYFSEQWIRHAAQALYSNARRLNWEPEVVVYLRRPDHLLNAHYAQYIKGNAGNTLDFETYFKDFRPRLDHLNILKIWSSVFSPEQLRVIPYECESIPAGIVANFLEHLPGLKPNCLWAHPAENLESLNITPGRGYIELMREINLRMSRRLPVPPREAILQSAFNNRSKNDTAANWLSPAGRYHLLNDYKKNYQVIANNYSKLANHAFFSEEWPEPSEDTSLSPVGFSADWVITLMQDVLEYTQKQRARKMKRLAVKIAVTILILSGMLYAAYHLH